MYSNSSKSFQVNFFLNNLVGFRGLLMKCLDSSSLLFFGARLRTWHIVFFFCAEDLTSAIKLFLVRVCSEAFRLVVNSANSYYIYSVIHNRLYNRLLNGSATHVWLQVAVGVSIVILYCVKVIEQVYHKGLVNAVEYWLGPTWSSIESCKLDNGAADTVKYKLRLNMIVLPPGI